jgi:hypothetical protein
MPAHRIGTRPVKSSRARYLPKHRPRLRLDVDAASGSYRIDAIATELYAEGIFLNREPVELFLKRLRRSVDFAGFYSLGAAQAELVTAPEQISLTKRFFEDVKAISHLIERNKTIDPHYVPLFVGFLRHGTGSCFDRTSSLLTKLRDVQAEIEGYLLDYRPRDGRGGNRDPLSYNFISEMLDVWRDFSDVPPEQAAAERAYTESMRDVPKMFRSEYRPFARLLGAAWRDLEFPIVDHRNESREPLEDWFADRVRKQFVDTGLPADEF